MKYRIAECRGRIVLAAGYGVTFEVGLVKEGVYDFIWGEIGWLAFLVLGGLEF